MDAGTMESSIGILVTIFIASMGFAVTKASFYQDVVSSNYFKFLLLISLLTYLIYIFVESFSNSLQTKLKETPKAVAVIKDSWESYSTDILWWALLLSIFWGLWFVLESLSRAMIKHNTKDKT
ncbi:hypothetical protein [Ewingella americana]|uniref:Uncharacterized protein n=1 Tax=Ewingella americana TaxID=41202 RepID=A0A502GHZ0_9GAMM|nr:hypothetical protein [Ewingella americana]TPG61484.1 hypothetical protein EAH77_12645 [Ewingella americana]